MKKHFPGFYPLEEACIKDLLGQATIVLDVDVLLNLFRFHPEDVRCFLSLLNDEHIKGKLWMPFDVAWLYHKRVNEEIQRQIDNINSVLSHLSSCKEAIENSKRYPYLDTNLMNQLQTVTNSITDACLKELDSLSKSLKRDEFKESLQLLFEGKIGEEYSEGYLDNIYEEGCQRYKKCEPPGYESEETQENRVRYHDLIIWKQMLYYARNNMHSCKGILFVTGKIRSDWYYIVNGNIISTRHELINEFLKEIEGNNTDNFFYCLSSKQFVDSIVSKYNVVHSQLSHLKEVLREELVYASVNADGMVNNQTDIPMDDE